MTWAALITLVATIATGISVMVATFIAWQQHRRVAVVVAVKGYTYTTPDGRSVTVRSHLRYVEHPRPWWWSAIQPQRLTGLAICLAGRKRVDVGCEWRTHLAGESGAGLSADRQLRDATGFVLAAIRYRLRDGADLAWRPVDAVLGSRALSGLFVLLASVGFSLWLMQKIGVYGLAQCLESVGVVFGAALGTIHVARWWRGVKPPEHKPRQAKKLRRTSVDKLPSY
jgi:hypothetical protein